MIIDGQISILEIMDPAELKVYTALRDVWIGDGDGYVLVYSITNRYSFTRIKRFYNQVARVRDSRAFRAPVSMMLVGNKCDQVTEREVSTQEGHALAEELECKFVEASAKTFLNVEKAFSEVVRSIRRQRMQETIRIKGDETPEQVAPKEQR